MATGDPVLTGSVITPAQSPITADPNFVLVTLPNGDQVAHLGILNPAPPADTKAALMEHLGPYVLNGVSVPCHWCWAEWTKRNNPIQVIKSPAQIVAAHRMFPFAGTVAAQPARVPYTIMGSSDVTIYEPTTGERADIGLVTDNGARFMLGQDPGPMLDWALVGETCPIHFMDQSTGQPINLLKYPQANAYDLPGYQGAPWLAKGPPNPNDGGYSTYGGGWTPQQAHHPEYCYLAHVATGDMGFLRSLQYHANFMVLTDSSKSTPSGAVISGEQRGLAWSLRNLFMAHIATKDAEANGLATGPGTPFLPSSYFQTLLDQSRVYYSSALTDPTNQIFHNFPTSERFGPWQHDYMMLALAFGILAGHSEWAPIFLFALGNVIDRLSGTSGYPPGWGGAYYLNTYPWAKNPDGTYNQGAFDTTQPFDWKQAFLFQQNDPGGAQPTAAQIAALTADQFNGGVAMVGGEYLQSTRAVIAAAQFLDDRGLCAVRAAYPNLDACFAVVDKMVGPNTEPRHAIVSNSSVASVSIPPPTTGVPIMSSSGDPLSALTAAVTQIKADVAAEIAAIHARIVALIAAATGNSVNATELQAQVDALNALHTTLTADTAAIPTATS